jgi:arylformamidase
MAECNVFGNRKIYDISTPLKADLPVFPGQPRFSREIMSSMAKGDRANVSKIQMTTHTGTHVDALFHFIDEGPTIDKVPFFNIVGPAQVFALDVTDKIDVADLESLNISENDIVIFKTRNSELWQNSEFTKDYVYLTAEAARLLAKRKVRAVGIDYIIPDAADDFARPVHKILFKDEIILIEGLDLTGVPAGNYLLIALPLKIIDADAAPARAILVAI